MHEPPAESTPLPYRTMVIPKLMISTHQLSPLEKLPTEILEKIFFEDIKKNNFSLPKASHIIGLKLSGKVGFILFICSSTSPLQRYIPGRSNPFNHWDTSHSNCLDDWDPYSFKLVEPLDYVVTQTLERLSSKTLELFKLLGYGSILFDDARCSYPEKVMLTSRSSAVNLKKGYH